MDNAAFQGIVDFVYWFFAGLFGFIQEGAKKIHETIGVPEWFLMLVVLGLMIIMLRQKMNTILFWGLLFGALIVIGGLAGGIDLAGMLGAASPP